MSIALLCAGCGFHLRTETLANYVSSVEITDAQSSRITQSLKRHLKQIGISVDSGTSPDVRVRISQHDFEKQASLLAPHGGMIEYELTLTVKLSIGLPVIQSDSDVITLSATQPVKVNAENLLSTSAEEQLVRRELTNTIVGEIIRILSYEMQRAPENKPIQKSED
ncbi:MAG: hypothetical protein OXG24_10700 [Gammaproteobacteria bacterium]|nr:hypothetical protein [Gammaproteobacteria bacterium]